MDFVSTGVKEVTRRLRRQRNRRALASARRLADRADIEFGRRGWQTLAEDESTRGHHEALVKLNEEVAAANAHITELEGKIRDLEAERELARKESKDALQAIEEERQPVAPQLPALTTRLSELNRATHDSQAKRNALMAERAALDKSDVRLQTSRWPEAKREERLRLSAQRRAAIAETLAAFDAAQAAAQPANVIEADIAKVRAQLADLDARARQARLTLAAKERAVTVAAAEFVKQIAATRRQTTRIEESKADPYLHLGRRLSELGKAPSGAESQFAEAKRRRQSYQRLLALEAAWLRESLEANKQDLRVFNFVVVTVITIILGSLLVLRTPPKRDWLPANTEAIVSLDMQRFNDAEFMRGLQSQEPAVWQAVWSALVRRASEVPGIDVRRQISRITRAMAPSPKGGPPVDYLLIDFRPFVPMETIMDDFSKKHGFGRQVLQGLPIYAKGDLALAQIGPSTLAVGTWNAVSTLIEVRLGLQEDLKTDAKFFNTFQHLSDDGAFRLLTQRPGGLTYQSTPLLEPGVLADCQAIGMTLDLREPVTAVLLINAADHAAAERVAQTIRSAPEHALQFPYDTGNLFVDPPTVQTTDRQVEWRFHLTGPAAREFLQRVSRLGLAGSAEAVARADGDGK